MLTYPPAFNWPYSFYWIVSRLAVFKPAYILIITKHTKYFLKLIHRFFDRIKIYNKVSILFQDEFSLKTNTQTKTIIMITTWFTFGGYGVSTKQANSSCYMRYSSNANQENELIKQNSVSRWLFYAFSSKFKPNVKHDFRVLGTYWTYSRL